MQPTHDVSSIASLLSALEENASSPAFWYRGQSNLDWELLPSLAREPDGLRRESNLLARFKQNASLLLPTPPSNDWEWLTIMQHYRVPTRLLDWSESPLVALYFAVVPHSDTDGALWILDPTRLNLASQISPDYGGYIPNFDDNLTSNYLPSALRAEQISKLEPIAVIGPRNTDRMRAQHGVFTVIHRNATPIELVGDQKHIRKLRIPESAKPTLRDELSLLAINKFQLFPELDSLGDILAGRPDA